MASRDASEDKSSSSLHYHVVLLGKTGNGKSATGNTILGRKAFLSKMSFKTVTQEVKRESITEGGATLTVYDTPGFFDPENELSLEEMYTRNDELPKLSTPDPLVILLVIRPDRLTQEEKKTVEMIEDYFPDWLMKNTWIIFTRGDELEREGQTIEDLIEESQDLKKIVHKFVERYFVFNNVAQDSEQRQVKKLIESIRTVQPQRFPETEGFLQRQSPAEDESSSSERRLILLGNTGSGKSATGNTILKENAFKSEHSFSSVTKECGFRRSKCSTQKVSVVDTPGFLDSTAKPEDLALNMANSVALCGPGPHAFLYVVSLTGKIKQEDEHNIKNIERIYGEEVAKYTIPIFTHSDQLEGRSVEDLIRENQTLSRFVQQCGGRYHVMNNKDPRNRKQVNELLQKIDKMTEKNGGYYTNEMFQYAQKSRRDEEREERFIERMWRKAKELYQAFERHFIAVAQMLLSLANRVIRLVSNVNVTCTTRDKTFDIPANTEEADKLINR
ncbi:GTPase IMAP family member 8-like [Puntigrus tetrazona]|uniref:GTPase IMAP family member 8-like n=1 Tax=Puntigrus tetrazona TaxID=1606681 RepID=UPI001C8A22CF|nr:GTPase IMAP family member 8-like [Puntigrus tetrazona]